MVTPSPARCTAGCIGLADGRAQAPDEGCTRTIPVRLDGRRILLSVSG